MLLKSPPRSIARRLTEGVTVHDLTGYSHGEVYDITQTNDDIHDGDILLVDGGVGIMVEAWPTMVVGVSDVLHKLGPGYTWDTLDGGKYSAAARQASGIIPPQ